MTIEGISHRPPISISFPEQLAQATKGKDWKRVLEILRAPDSLESTDSDLFKHVWEKAKGDSASSVLHQMVHTLSPCTVSSDLAQWAVNEDRLLFDSLLQRNDPVIFFALAKAVVELEKWELLEELRKSPFWEKLQPSELARLLVTAISMNSLSTFRALVEKGCYERLCLEGRAYLFQMTMEQQAWDFLEVLVDQPTDESLLNWEEKQLKLYFQTGTQYAATSKGIHLFLRITIANHDLANLTTVTQNIVRQGATELLDEIATSNLFSVVAFREGLSLFLIASERGGIPSVRALIAKGCYRKLSLEEKVLLFKKLSEWGNYSVMDLLLQEIESESLEPFFPSFQEVASNPQMLSEHLEAFNHPILRQERFRKRLAQMHPDLKGRSFEEQLFCVEALTASLHNRQLKGHSVWDLRALDSLCSKDIDLARGLLLNEFHDQDGAQDHIRFYEAELDLMALTIQSRLKSDDPSEIVDGIRHLVYDEMEFYYPETTPFFDDHMESFGLLSNILNNRECMCLGSTILFLSLAQRLGLSLSVIYIPSHVFLQYQGKDGKSSDIETVRSNPYKDDSIRSPDSPVDYNDRTFGTTKSLIGQVYTYELDRFFKTASSNGKEFFSALVSRLRKITTYLESMEYTAYLAIGLLFLGKEQEGTSLLTLLPYLGKSDPEAYSTLEEDYLEGHVDTYSLSILLRGETGTLQQVMKTHPEFRAGWVKLAHYYKRNNMPYEAYQSLQKFHQLDSTNSLIEREIVQLASELEAEQA